jgi:hypothetical protein
MLLKVLVRQFHPSKLVLKFVPAIVTPQIYSKTEVHLVDKLPVREKTPHSSPVTQ